MRSAAGSFGRRLLESWLRCHPVSMSACREKASSPALSCAAEDAVGTRAPRPGLPSWRVGSAVLAQQRWCSLLLQGGDKGHRKLFQQQLLKLYGAQLQPTEAASITCAQVPYPRFGLARWHLCSSSPEFAA